MGEMIKFGIKMAFILTVTLAFMSAVFTLVNLIVSVTGSSVISEIFGIISCCLPFDSSSVFSGIYATLVAILGFLVARKIFGLSSKSMESVS